MGYIKKLKNNELVGGTDKTTIYPVTSTEAVFEEITNGNESSFKSQKTINGEHDDRIKGLEDEMPDTVKSITINGGTKKYTVDDEGNVALTVYTVDGDPEMPTIAEAVQTNTESIEAVQNTINGLDTTLSSEDSHVSVSVNQSNGLINGLNVTTNDIASAADLAALTSGIEGLRGPNVIITPNHLNVSNPQENTIYREQGENTTYKDWSYADGTWYPMATYDIGNLDPQVSYYTCTTGAATPAKTATGTDASAYALTLGGHFKVEMDEANTATSGVTLQVGNASAKELMYNGASVNAGNTWEAGEVIAVYYYNNKYWASNAQGGGGKAEKIKYDNSQSGLAADNVQDGIDEVVEDITFPDESSDFFEGTLNAPKTTQCRYYLPYRFSDANIYEFTATIPTAASGGDLGIYVYKTGQYSNNIARRIGQINNGSSSAIFEYVPEAETNYQFIGFWNAGNDRNVTLQITEIKKGKNLKSEFETVAPIVYNYQEESELSTLFPEKKIKTSEVIDVASLPLKDCGLDASGKWFNASSGLGGRHVAISVNATDTLLIREYSNCYYGWIGSSDYDPETTYTSGTDAKLIGGRLTMTGENLVLYPPANGYLILVEVGGDYLRYKAPYSIERITSFSNSNTQLTFVGDDTFDVVSTDSTIIECVKSGNGFTFINHSNVGGNYAAGSVGPLVVGHNYRIKFTAVARVKTTGYFAGLLRFVYENPLASSQGAYVFVILSKTNQTEFEWNFTAKTSTAYFRVASTDMGAPNYGEATLIIRDIVLEDLGTTNIQDLVPDIMAPITKNIEAKIDEQSMLNVTDTGLYVVDRYLNIGAYIDETGIHSINI